MQRIRPELSVALSRHTLVWLLLGWLIPASAPALIRVGGLLDVQARDLEIVGRLAYVADYTAGLRVIDVSNPAAPEVISETGPAGAIDVEVMGDLAFLYVALDQVAVIDISDPKKPFVRASITDPACVGPVEAVNGIAYMGNFSLCAFDLSNPSSPRLLGSRRILGFATDIDVVGEVAYIATNIISPFSFLTSGSLELIDVSRPEVLAPLSRVQLSSPAADVVVNDRVAWVSRYDSLTSIDVSDPSAASQLGTLDFPGSVWRHLETLGSTGFLSDGHLGLRAIDLSDPTLPVLLGSFDTPGTAHSVKLVGKLAFVADWDGLEVIDVSWPFAPVELSRTPTPAPALGLALDNGRAYVAGRSLRSGFLSILDLADPTSPVRAGEIEVADPVTDIALGGSTAYLAGWAFRTIDVSDPERPVPLARLDAFANSLHLNGSLILADRRKIDVSDPSMPLDRGFLAIAGVDLELVDGLVYSADHEFGLRVSDFETSATLATVPGLQSATCIHLDRTTAYVGEKLRSDGQGTGPGWLRLVDISDPRSPEALATLKTYGAVHDIEVDGGLAYLATGGYWGSVVAIDVADPARPVALGGVATPGSQEDVEAEDGLVYLADGTGGLRVFDFGPEYQQARVAPPLLVDLAFEPHRDGVVEAGRRNLTVAVLGPEKLLLSGVDPSSITFGPDGARPHKRLRYRDVDGDGREDLLARFDLAAAGLGLGETEACLSASIRDGRRILGCGTVRVQARKR